MLADIAKARGKTTAQVMFKFRKIGNCKDCCLDNSRKYVLLVQVALRWVYEQGVSLVAKSFNKERMKENLQIFDWSLSEEELDKISKMPQRKGVILASVFGPHDFVLQLDAEV